MEGWERDRHPSQRLLATPAISLRVSHVNEEAALDILAPAEAMWKRREPSMERRDALLLLVGMEVLAPHLFSVTSLVAGDGTLVIPRQCSPLCLCLCRWVWG